MEEHPRYIVSKPSIILKEGEIIIQEAPDSEGNSLQVNIGNMDFNLNKKLVNEFVLALKEKRNEVQRH